MWDSTSSKWIEYDPFTSNQLPEKEEEAPPKRKADEPALGIRRFFRNHEPQASPPDCSRQVTLREWGKPRWLTIRDIPEGSTRVTLYILRRRYMCLDCKRTYFEPVPGIDEPPDEATCRLAPTSNVRPSEEKLKRRGRKGRRLTKRMTRHIADCAIKQSHSEIARELGVDAKTVRGIDREYNYSRVADNQYKFEVPRYLGIDNVRINGINCVICIDLERGSVIELLQVTSRKEYVCLLTKMKILKDHVSNTKHKIINDWLMEINKGKWVKHDNNNADVEKDHLAGIQGVVIDGDDNIRRVLRKNLKQTCIILDRFHLVKYAKNGMDKARIRIALDMKGRFGKTSAHAEGILYPELASLLKQERKLFLRNVENLNDDEIKILLDMLTSNNELLQAYALMLCYQNITKACSKREAETAIEAWTKMYETLSSKQQKDFRTASNMLDGWRKEILAYWTHAVTNSLTENANGRIKKFARRTNSYNFEDIRKRVLLGIGQQYREVKRCQICTADYKIGWILPEGITTCEMVNQNGDPLIMSEVLVPQRRVCGQCSENLDNVGEEFYQTRLTSMFAKRWTDSPKREAKLNLKIHFSAILEQISNISKGQQEKSHSYSGITTTYRRIPKQDKHAVSKFRQEIFERDKEIRSNKSIKPGYKSEGTLFKFD